MFPGQAGGRLDGRDDDAKHVDRPAEGAAIAGQPGLLQPTERHRSGGIARKNDEVATGVEQSLAARAGQVDDLLARPTPVGSHRLIRQIDEVGRG